MSAAVDSPEAEALKAKIDEQGNKIRSLKTEGAEKSTIEQHVQNLLQLKQEYKSLTGVDLAGGGSSKKDKKAAKKANTEAAVDKKAQPKAKSPKTEPVKSQSVPAKTDQPPASVPAAAAASNDAASIMARMADRDKELDRIIKEVTAKVPLLKEQKIASLIKVEEERLKRENENLRRQVENMRERLVAAEIRNGVKQIPLPTSAPVATTGATKPAAKKVEAKPGAAPNKKPEASGQAESDQAPAQKKEAKKKEKKAEVKGASSAPAAGDDKVDVSRVDMRVGKIVEVKRHEDADSLYVEQVDVGEEKPRTVVSGLVKFVPIEEMQDRLAIFTCNLKPAKMRGVFSEGMIMCGSSPEKVEIINVPAGAKIGDKVYVEGFEGTPDAVMNPKKKIFEQIQPDFRIDDSGVAMYRGKPWKVQGVDGLCTVPTMRDSIIK